MVCNILIGMTKNLVGEQEMNRTDLIEQIKMSVVDLYRAGGEVERRMHKELIFNYLKELE